jgi:hypothetical protein
LNVLQEMWDLFEPEAVECQDMEAPDSSPKQIYTTILEAVFSGSAALGTLKIKGSIQGLEILILID